MSTVGVDAVGYQAHDPSGDEHPELVLTMVQVVRSTGGIGVYMPQDSGASTDLAKEGRIPGSTALQPAPALPDRHRPRHAVVDRKPRTVPEEAVEGYWHFDDRDNGWTKVLLHPGQYA